MLNTPQSSQRADKVFLIKRIGGKKVYDLTQSRDLEQQTLQSNYRAAEQEVYRIETAMRSENARIVELQGLLKKMVDERERLLAEFDKVASTEWNQTEASCPCCGRELQPEKIEQLRAEFNIKRSKRLEEIQELGKKTCSGQRIRDREIEITELEEERLGADQLMAAKKAMHEAAEASRAAFERYRVAIKEAEDNIEKEILEVGEETVVSNPTKEVDLEINDLEEALRSLNTSLSLFDIAKIQSKRIDTLQEERKQVAKEFEQLDLGLKLVETFTKTKMDLLNANVNKMFKSVSFRLFVEQVNGGIKEDCEVLVPGPSGQFVPFMFANNAARINAGLEIIEALSRHYKLNMPVFVDNAEAVTKLHKSDYQLIQLIVSEADKKLRITQ